MKKVNIRLINDLVFGDAYFIDSSDISVTIKDTDGTIYIIPNTSILFIIPLDDGTDEQNKG